MQLFLLFTLFSLFALAVTTSPLASPHALCEGHKDGDVIPQADSNTICFCLDGLYSCQSLGPGSSGIEPSPICDLHPKDTKFTDNGKSCICIGNHVRCINDAAPPPPPPQGDICQGRKDGDLIPQGDNICFCLDGVQSCQPKGPGSADGEPSPICQIHPDGVKFVNEGQSCICTGKHVWCRKDSVPTRVGICKDNQQDGVRFQGASDTICICTAGVPSCKPREEALKGPDRIGICKNNGDGVRFQGASGTVCICTAGVPSCNAKTD